MKRMVDNKKLKEIEANGGTQWYKHDITFKGTYGSTSNLILLSLRQDSFKEGEWTPGYYPIFLTNFGGPSGPNLNATFPTLNVPSSNEFYIYFINSNNVIDSFTFNKASIISEKVTAL